MLTESHLFREIHEQPAVLKQLLTSARESIRELANAIRQREISHVVIAARGTSDNAGRYAQYVLGSVNGLVVALATPSLFSLYKKPTRFKQAIAATKTYTAELAAIALLSATLAADGDMLAALEQLPESVATTLTMNDTIAAIAPRYRYMQRSIVIGRGYNYATAFELALKLKELTYTIVEPYSSADFLHGPLALIEQGFPVIVIAPSGVLQSEMQQFTRTLQQRQAEIIAISDDPDILTLARIPLAMPQTTPEWLSPITAIVPGQLFSLHLAHTRDYDVDRPRALNKVTETN